MQPTHKEKVWVNVIIELKVTTLGAENKVLLLSVGKQVMTKCRRDNQPCSVRLIPRKEKRYFHISRSRPRSANMTAI